MQTLFSRRMLLKLMGLGVASALTPGALRAESLSKVVVVGGGFAGSTVAKYLKLWGGSSVDVTLIESNSNYVSPILSNLVLNQTKSTADLTFNYDKHSATYGINVVHDTLSSIDKTNQQVNLTSGNLVEYDRLVLAPGIDFEDVSGLDFEKVPHAWKAGSQTNLLRDLIANMQDGDHFVMTVPKAPYRCPPGPYERACLVADYLQNSKGFENCSVTVLDANPGITVEADTFSQKFSEYGVDYRANVVLSSVDSDALSVSFYQNSDTIQTIEADVLNVIPNQKAASLIFDAGLNQGNWAPVNPLNYESTLAENIFIIGDSQATSQPKAGHMGNSQAKICADGVLRSLNGMQPYAKPKTNSACYSPVSSNQATWLTAVYEYNLVTQDMKLVEAGNYPTAGAPSYQNYQDMFRWSENLFSDTFG